VDQVLIDTNVLVYSHDLEGVRFLNPFSPKFDFEAWIRSRE
jgi:hypothetical protein